MSATDRLVTNAARYAETFTGGDLPIPPALGVAVVACMDARLHLYRLLGLAEGDAHIIRNAGGTVTADTRRSLAISQRLLGTREIVLVHHTDCGMTSFAGDEFLAQIEAETGVRPEWSAETFADPAQDVRQSIARILADPAIPHRDSVRGFVFDVKTGALTEVR
jgi:carbonic anhydrase